MYRYALFLAILCQASCSSGDGSDIGPSRPDLPDGSCKISVFDDSGRGVVGARVAVHGSGLQAITGHNGRGDLRNNVSGSIVFSVDGANAAASHGDDLGRLTVAALVQSRDIPFPVYLPDLQGSNGLGLTVGTQATTSVLDDLASSGARITIPSGSSLGMPGAVADIRLRSGSLQPQHLTAGLPDHPASAWLFGRGIYIDPPEATFFPAVDLEVADDLLLGSLTATLFHLDQLTGTWQVVADGLVSQAGLLQATGLLARGGLYAFGCLVTAGAVTGKIVDASTPPRGLPGMQVMVDGRPFSSGSDGVFTAVGIPATVGVGTRRSAQIVVHAGGSWLPATLAASVVMNGGATVNAGDLVLDTLPASTIYMQMIRRGRADGLRSSAVSSLFGGVALATLADSNGQAVFEDVPSRWFGFQSGYPLDREQIYYAQGVSFIPDGRRWQNATQFIDRRQWWSSPRSQRLLATDSVGGGPLRSVAFVKGRSSGTGLIGITREGGSLLANRDSAGRITGVLESTRGNEVLVHALSIERPSGQVVEFPLEQLRRSPLGAFDRHGVLQGRLTSVDPSREHRIRATRRFELQEWWQEVVAGGPVISRLPVDIDPALTHDEFRTGLAARVGHVVAAETSNSGGVDRLEKLGLITDLRVADGSVSNADIDLAHVASVSFRAPNLLALLDPAIPIADLRMDLALQQPSGLGIDVARGLGGNHAASGDDLVVTLPGLGGALAGHRWWGILSGEATVGGQEVGQGVLLRFQPAAVPVSFLPLPAITAPAPGATVDPQGFTVEFSLPSGAVYGLLELRSESPGETLVWQAYVPPSLTTFAYVRLPTQAANPLRSGKTYRLRLSAFGSRTGILVGAGRPYQKSTSTLQSVGAIERGVDCFSSQSILLQTN